MQVGVDERDDTASRAATTTSITTAAASLAAAAAATAATTSATTATAATTARTVAATTSTTGTSITTAGGADVIASKIVDHPSRARTTNKRSCNVEGSWEKGKGGGGEEEFRGTESRSQSTWCKTPPYH